MNEYAIRQRPDLVYICTDNLEVVATTNHHHQSYGSGLTQTLINIAQRELPGTSCKGKNKYNTVCIVCLF